MRTATFLLAAVSIATLWFTLASSASAQTPPPNSVRVTIDCAATPQRVVVYNTLASTITVTSLTSTVAPRAGLEPFPLSVPVAAGSAVSFLFGQGPSAGGLLLSGTPIFEAAPFEGAQLLTSAGSFTLRCSEGMVTRTAPGTPVPPVTPPSTGDAGLSREAATHTGFALPAACLGLLLLTLLGARRLRRQSRLPQARR